ncbi:MAG: response regulator transcription factor [Ignavibacteriales bacterium]|nr:response regulator transcription factor [Ignavibacteriales bacterium]MCF8306708.1 response regulator transcription factor [Ignavibacteriales bacterium]MCF8316192.1 response regulator transcription factor [Ignavibacteriales bacterium]MCF8437776.1 response regulator transcription factor [Ignavibacteriales bacterium]
MKLLIADDNTDIRNLLRRLSKFCPQCTEIIESTRGDETIAAAAEERPNIILMDIVMEGTNGLEATKAIKEFLPSVKIIVITQLPEIDYKNESIQAGADIFLIKEELYKLPEILNKITSNIN